jgi:hypothetical protein
MKNYLLGISIIVGIFIFTFANSVEAYERVFHEDCEDTGFSQFFLEKYYGTTYQEYWNELTTEITRSTDACNGQYSMTYDPWLTNNPHSIIGYDTIYGNTSDFDLNSINSRYWYFRWNQKWEENISYEGNIENKLLYINYSGEGDFVFTVKKREAYKFHITIKDLDTYSLIRNDYFHTVDDISLDDMQWHKLELFFDVGTTGNDNGSYKFKVDDVVLSEANGIQFNGTIHSNPIDHLTGWPSNAPRVSQPPGTGRTWLDDLEIYILDDEDDLPTNSPEIHADVNQDGNINIIDSQLTLRETLGLDMSSTGWESSDTTGNANCDGALNITDIRLILRYSLGLNMTGTGWCE